MRFFGAIAILVLAVSCFSCRAVAIRPVYESFEADVEFDGNILNVDSGKHERDTDFSRYGIEFAGTTFSDLEFFADISGSEIKKEEPNIADIDADGYEVGIGVRSPWPTEPGWGLDWGARVSYHDTEDDYDLSGNDVDDDLKGYGFDVHIGPSYSMVYNEDFVFAPHAGILYKGVHGKRDADNDIIKVSDQDYDLDSVGGYIGFRLHPIEIKMFDVQANFYAGSESMLGVFVAVGIKF